MIARIWRGRTDAEKADEYVSYLRQTGLPDYRNTPGNLGAYVLRRVENGKAHFLTLSFWNSVEAIRAFAGDDYDRARYYPMDTEFLLEFQPAVEHYEVFTQEEE